MVPTMGALHEGHLSLIRAARAENDVVVVSIFVNPTQFGPSEDLAKYPRDLERDLPLAREAGADLVFNPSVAEMYRATTTPPGWKWRGSPTGCAGARGRATSGACARWSPSCFAICQPDRAYFGEKDAQQLAVIQRMVRDLNMRVEIVPCPTVREADGLAMSSRNVGLTPEQRAQAPVLYRALTAAQAAVAAGETRCGGHRRPDPDSAGGRRPWARSTTWRSCAPTT